MIGGRTALINGELDRLKYRQITSDKVICFYLVLAALEDINLVYFLHVLFPDCWRLNRSLAIYRIDIGKPILTLKFYTQTTLVKR